MEASRCEGRLLIVGCSSTRTTTTEQTADLQGCITKGYPRRNNKPSFSSVSTEILNGDNSKETHETNRHWMKRDGYGRLLQAVSRVDDGHGGQAVYLRHLLRDKPFLAFQPYSSNRG